MSELRVDPLTGTLVIVAPGRAARPDTFAVKPADRSDAAACPFCPGHELETPPETARAGGGAPDGPGWTIRVVPNKFPVVAPDGPDLRGEHEVIVLSPDHEQAFADLEPDHARGVLAMMRARVRVHLEHGFPYAHTFINFGAEAGASIAHPHAQLVALDFVPPAVTATSGRFEEHHGLLADLAADSARRDLVVRRDDAVTWCPAASRSPFEMLIRPPDAESRFDLADDHALAAVSDALHDALGRVQRVLGRDAPYNVIFDTGPIDAPYEWFVRVIPRVTVTAGFERATDVYINTVPPEAAAAELRRAG